MLARALSRDPSVLLVCQPTRGVDLGAVERLHAEILRRRDAGAAILLISTELSEVMAVRVHLSSLEDVMASKLMALTEQEPNFAAPLEWARALREQIDWDEVRARSQSSPFARAFFTLVEGLGIVEPARSEEEARPG